MLRLKNSNKIVCWVAGYVLICQLAQLNTRRKTYWERRENNPD